MNTMDRISHIIDSTGAGRKGVLYWGFVGWWWLPFSWLVKLMFRHRVALSFAVANFVILYPWVYTAFDNIGCKPHGTLSIMRLRCTCPESRGGDMCNDCNIPVARGVCVGTTVLCKGKWTGPQCDICDAVRSHDNMICDGPCQRNSSFYDDPSTGKCTWCNATLSCSGNGNCSSTGKCICDAGYAGVGTASLVGFGDCSLPCPVNTKNEPCNGHGTCVGGGYCQCTGAWCGPDCTDLTGLNASSKPCSGNGYPIQLYDVKINNGGKACACECRTDKYNTPAFLGSYCQAKCPIGTGARVCGLGIGGVQPLSVLVGDKCMCSCGRGLSNWPCESDCHYGGVEDLEGQCTCPGAHAVSPCDRCEPGWFIPQIGCTQFCVDTVTCQSGGCAPKKDDPLVVTCADCYGNRKGDIVTWVQSTEVDNLIWGLSNATRISFEQVFLVGDEKRELVLFPAMPSHGDPAVVTLSGGIPTLALSGSMGATILLDPLATYFTSTPETLHPLSDRIAYPLAGDISYWMAELPAVRTYNNSRLANYSVGVVCMELADCIAYSDHNGGELYSHLCDPSKSAVGCTSQRALGNVTVVVSHVLLHTKVWYTAKVVDTLTRGCHECLDSWYPHPEIAVIGGTPACTEFCDVMSCNYMGNCTDMGACVCDYPHMGPHCTNCTEGYFPAPRFARNGTIPCSIECHDDTFPNPDIDANACSGHGYCDPATGKCDCRNGPGEGANGWRGIPAGSACDIACIEGSKNSTAVCNNNGKCIYGTCACYDGYFGSHCQITCNRDDQYFWVEDAPPWACPSSAPGCDTGQSCGNGNTCTRLRCNGGACTRRYQYEHAYGESYKSIHYHHCNVTDDLGSQPLRECTSFTSEQYDNLNQSQYGNDPKGYIEKTLGIFCDVSHESVASLLETGNQWQSLNGICARTECNCNGHSQHMQTGMTAREIVYGAAGTEKTISPISRAGAGCQYVGCSQAEFGTEGASYTSPCGSLPPPATREGDALQMMYGSDTAAKGYQLLDAFVRTIPQFCSHGECKSEHPTIWGTMANPAPRGVQASDGVCMCKNSPQSTPQCRGSGAIREDWAGDCCSGYQELQSNPLVPPRVSTSAFYGDNCQEHCACAMSDYSRGTCIWGGNAKVMGVACTCRGGWYEGGHLEPVNQLYCGATCRNQCMGVIDGSGNPVGWAIEAGCPNDLAKDDKPAFQEGCYDNYKPCYGNGACMGVGGRCLSGITDQSFAKCVCNGGDVNIGNRDEGGGGALTNQIMLPPRVSLFGGDDCSMPCPGAEDGGVHSPSAFYNDNVELLVGTDPFTNSTALSAIGHFAEYYSAYVCSGHGYCAPSSKIVNDTLQCTCTGNWGGTTCNERCELPDFYWLAEDEATVVRPFQDQLVNDSSKSIGENELLQQGIELALAEEYGLDLCGPHSSCDGTTKKCEIGQGPLVSKGHYAPMFWGSRADTTGNVSTYVSNLAPEGTDVTAFVEQWALAFVGPFSTCKPPSADGAEAGYYTSRPVGGSGGLHDSVSGEPPLVRWHLTRTCDHQFKYNANEPGVPWCCQEPSSPSTVRGFEQWQDEAYAPEGHGGCPEGLCPNFATGRTCTQCINPGAYGHFLDGRPTCSTNSPIQDSGYCTICKRQGTLQMIAPFAYAGPLNAWPSNPAVASAHQCEQCISSGLTLSGRQALVTPAEAEKAVCNNDEIAMVAASLPPNKCIGVTNTYSERSTDPTLNPLAQATEAPSGHSLLVAGGDIVSLQTHLRLGLCQCGKDRNGPTCAMPATDEACNSAKGRGHRVPIGETPSDYGDVDQYYYCVCSAGYYGMYCENGGKLDIDYVESGDASQTVDMGPCVALVFSTETSALSIQECNGQAQCIDGQCGECADRRLDPFTSCREYKAKGSRGIRTRHQLGLLQKTGNQQDAASYRVLSDELQQELTLA